MKKKSDEGIRSHDLDNKRMSSNFLSTFEPGENLAAVKPSEPYCVPVNILTFDRSRPDASDDEVWSPVSSGHWTVLAAALLAADLQRFSNKRYGELTIHSCTRVLCGNL